MGNPRRRAAGSPAGTGGQFAPNAAPDAPKPAQNMTLGGRVPENGPDPYAAHEYTPGESGLCHWCGKHRYDFDHNDSGYGHMSFALVRSEDYHVVDKASEAAVTALDAEQDDDPAAARAVFLAIEETLDDTLVRLPWMTSDNEFARGLGYQDDSTRVANVYSAALAAASDKRPRIGEIISLGLRD